MEERGDVILRKPYKRVRGLVPTLRRAYKRGRPPIDERVPPPPPKDTRPRWFLDALMAGEMRCPRKWSSLALELCAQIQGESASGCIAARCSFFGTAPMLMDEVRAAKKTGIAPKTGARGRLNVLPPGD